MVERNSGVLATKDEVRFSIFFFSRPIETVAEWCIPGGKRDESLLGILLLLE